MKPQEQLRPSRRGALLGLSVPTAACEGGPVLPAVVSSLDATMWDMWVWRVPASSCRAGWCAWPQDGHHLPWMGLREGVLLPRAACPAWHPAALTWAGQAGQARDPVSTSGALGVWLLSILRG